ncbi:predicted protein [Uncinocarpus reesii 1704]|uniref:Methyltransferase type 11 domain-containing protein n=1 Tax=Uncinocarpus reesii (strain UAMH 1704) TaxID=336963 RepID=C4JJP6_UNCRE|nr:uncharacterized protein UREG_01853 [Uncinocarpus reesii 1704]EEP77004.1 predicted protein [Uncinocarpus reesii 1704]
MSSRKPSRVGTPSSAETAPAAPVSRSSRIPTASSMRSATPKSQASFKYTPSLPKGSRYPGAPEPETRQRDNIGTNVTKSKGLSQHLGLPRALAPGASSLPHVEPLSSSKNTSMTSRTSAKSPRNVLRRKAPSIEGEPLSDSTKRFPPPPPARTPVTPVETPQPDMNKTIAPELLGLSAGGTLNLPPPTPNFTSSPSTRYSESPGLWSSRTSTPTSLSSYSPGLTHSSKVGSRLRQPSPSLFRSHPPRYHVSGASYPGATKDVPVFPKGPQRSQTEPVRVPGSKLPTKTQLDLESAIKSETQPRLHLQTPHSDPKSPRQEMTFQQNAAANEKEGLNVDRSTKLPQKFQRIEAFQYSKTVTPPKYPARPSRTGTETLELQASPVIHSNLPSSRLPAHRRQSSAESGHVNKSAENPILRNVSTDSLQSKSSSRIPHPSPSPSKFEKIDSHPSFTASTGQVLSRKKSVLVKESKDQKEDSGARRFGFFSKRSRASPELSRSEPVDKTRRGPAAGTGHEGYSRYAQRGRRTSIGSNASRARSTSTNGSTGNVSRGHSDLDDFLLDRLEPVIITGGAGDGSKLSRTCSEQSVSGLSVTSSLSSQIPSRTAKFYNQSSESLISSAGRFVHSPEPMSGTSTVSLSKSKGELNPAPTIAKRRSFRKPNLFTKSSGNGALSINTDVPRLAPPVDSSTTYRTSISQSDASTMAREDEPKDIQESKKKKSQKLGKWNFFQRSHQLRRKEHFTESDLASITKVPVSVSKVPTSRTVAHYALVDCDPIESDSLEDILNRIEESPPTEADIQEPSSVIDLKRQQSVLLPAPPVGLAEYTFERRPSSPKVFFGKDTSPSTPELKPRPSGSTRLKSVGRIPVVVPRENRQHKPPPQSFSRPFSRADMPSITALCDGGVSSPDYPDCSAAFSSSNNISSRPLMTDMLEARPVAPVPGAADSHYFPTDDPEFLVISPRKGSDVSGSSSTESRKSLGAITAVVPAPGSKLTEDEIWYEYDDFIDKVLTPPTQEIGLSNRNSFQLAARASRVLQAGLNAMGDNTRLSCQSECSQVTTPMSSLPTNSVHLSRSMILSALHSSSAALSSPVSLSELYSYYSERSQTIPTSATLDTMSSLEVPQNRQATHYDGSQSKEPDRQKNATLLDIAERERLGALAQANLRSGSLMTSRWLSFGRVLFSPAQNHVRSEDQSRILVIDGLGNDDWSFYCALTYPTATIYNLSIFPSGSTSSNPAAWEPPANHRSVHHAIFESPFPFPKGFFTAAILRFPAACSEIGLRNAVSECKRVLRTGGYLEMTILDLDMVNMGSRTRKAVRKLKERIFATDPSISLKPASDNIQKLLGKRGFQNLNRCMVVVPVAGTIMKSSDTSSSSHTTAPTNSTTPIDSFPPPSASTIPGSHSHTRPPSDVNVSLGDLLSDPSPSESNDECIARMVAKVGRWWYTRCYEAPVLPEGNIDNSIWADRRLLRECQRRGTGFKLLIAYAQKPSEVTRRTVSV